jgi:hypothetical protein
LRLAPASRTLHLGGCVETPEEALGAGIVTGHLSMPEFCLGPGQIADLIAFLETLQ